MTAVVPGFSPAVACLQLGPVSAGELVADARGKKSLRTSTPFEEDADPLPHDDHVLTHRIDVAAQDSQSSIHAIEPLIDQQESAVEQFRLLTKALVEAAIDQLRLLPKGFVETAVKQLRLSAKMFSENLIEVFPDFFIGMR